MNGKRASSGKKPRWQTKPTTNQNDQSPVNWPADGALLVIDERPIRRATLRAYRRAERQVSQARERLEAYETGDLPAFIRWEAQVFGALMSELREIAAVLSGKQYLLAQIQQEMFWTGCDRLTAYLRIMEAKNNPTPLPLPEDHPGAGTGFSSTGPGESADDPPPKLFGTSDLPPDFDLAEYDRMSPAEQRRVREEYEDASFTFELMTGHSPPDFDDLIDRERAAREESADDAGDPFPVEGSGDSRVNRTPLGIKELYRTLVRRLHPDVSGPHTARERDLWHQVQDAYRARDLEWLEAVAGRLDAVHRGAKSLSIQLLRRMTADLLGALHGLRAQLSRRRWHAAWRFREKSGALEKLEQRLRRKLEAERNRGRKALTKAERIIGDLEARAARINNRAAKRKKAASAASAVQGSFQF